jgi:hypothetical protein
MAVDWIYVLYSMQKKVWSADLSQPTFPLTQLSHFYTHEGAATDLCTSIVQVHQVTPPCAGRSTMVVVDHMEIGFLYAMGCDDYVEPYYILEITIATGKVFGHHCLPPPHSISALLTIR